MKGLSDGARSPSACLEKEGTGMVLRSVDCCELALMVTLTVSSVALPAPARVPMFAPPLISAAYVQHSQACFKKGEYDQAIAACNEAIRITPNFALAYAWRGRCYGGKSDYN